MDESTNATRRIVLVHGIWNARSWLTPLARRLRGDGFEVDVFGYPSIVGGPEPAITALIGRLRGGPPVHLLGHSLGGMIALEALRRAPDLPVQRVVCLGSPLCGSQAARSLGDFTLVSCSVAPEFRFEGFRLLADDPLAQAEWPWLIEQHPELL